MSSQKRIIQRGRIGTVAGTVAMLGIGAISAEAKKVPCAAANLASLQACINTAATVGDTANKDTVVVQLAAGLYDGNAANQQVRINRKQNLWIVGDTTADESTQPRILYQDRKHVYTDLDIVLRNDTTAAGTYGQNNGAVWIHMSDNIRLMGILIDGNSSTSRANAAERIFAYGATLGKTAPVEIRGNVGVNILLSRNVQLRYLSVTNAWNGVSIISPNLGGAFSFPDPNDPPEEKVSTLPTSKSGLYGNHLIERCRIHDNVFGVLFQRDWDLSSVVRNNLFWGNYLRHWSDPRTPGSTGSACPTSEYIANLCRLDTTRRADGSRRSLAYTTVGGAFLMTDAALTPYRIHNNTFFNNATIFSGYYKTGTQHLFYNNLVGRPYQSFRRAADLEVEWRDDQKKYLYAYTQTERNSEMLQYMSEHQRANRVVAQDSIPRNTGVVPDYWSGGGGNFRLYNMRVIRNANKGWVNARSWSNNDNDRDSLGMTWVPDTAAAGTIAAQADTGGVVNWIRHNMWTGAKPDPEDPYGSNWCPPWLPVNIRKSLGDPTIFRNTSAFDVRWTLGLPLDTTSSSTSSAWLTPKASNLKMTGWPTYEGTATSTLPIGAYDATGKWAAPARRIILRDTLIETVTDAFVKFGMNVSGENLSNDDIVKLEVQSAKFYNDVPVSDTLYNQGPVTLTPLTTTTRVNSILSSKPWPLPYQFQSTDYNRAGFNVDDSLTKRKLGPDNVFLASVPVGYRLHSDSLYARAEVVLKATLKDGSIVYSNPGVFMFSRPRFQFVVTVLDAVTKKPLPLDADGVSLIAQARQPLQVAIKAKTISLPVDFKGFANLQMGSAGGLHGTDGKQFEQAEGVTWTVRRPNDTVVDSFDKNATVFDTLRALSSPSNGTLIYRAVFLGLTEKEKKDTLLPFFIEGRSQPIKVVSGAIYQVTIDSVYRQDSIRILAPSVKLKLAANEKLRGRRDTILVDGADTSMNRVNVLKGEVLRVVLQVRDKYGNEVRDSASAIKGLYINLAHVLAATGRYPNVATDPKTISIDSGANSLQSVRFAFDSLGRAYADVRIAEILSRSSLVALRATIVDSIGRELGTTGTRDSGVADTTWLKTQQILTALQWTDTLGGDFKSIPSGWVGEWYPVRLKLTKDLRGSVMTGTLPIAALAPVSFHPAKGDTSRISVATFANDSLSRVVWVRADDSVTGAWIRGNIDSTEVRANNLNFAYPKVVSSSFHDFNCDGKIDSLVLRMDGPVAYRAASGVVGGDTLDLLFPHQQESPSAKGVPLRYKLYNDSVMTFAWDPATIGPADNLANKVVVGNPLVAGKTIVYTLKGLRDLAPPIALAAFDKQTWANGQTDSLVVQFSETIDLSNFGTGKALPFAIIRGGTRVPMANVKLQKTAYPVDSGRYVFQFNGGAGVIQPGDSLEIDGTSVSDLAGNLSGTSCPNTRIRIDVVPRYVPTQGYVLDIDGDGNADSVHLGFKDSLGSLPETFLVRWGTPAETLTVSKAQLIAQGVKTSDSTITVGTRGWKGQTILLPIDGTNRVDTIRNAPRTVGPADTTYFEGGVVWEWLADRVPPVVVRARLYWAANLMDTMVVNFSESVKGCEKGSDPAKCLSSTEAKSKLKFSEGSTILSAEGKEWRVLVPRTATSFVPGDSLRGTPSGAGGLLVDAVANKSGAASPYVVVLGDPAPPNRGLMLDRDGDGKVDAVLLQYASKPTVSKLPSFTFGWADSTGAKVTLRSDSAYAVDSTRWIAVLATPGAFPVTGYAAAATELLGTQQVTMTYRFPVYDSVGAVLKPKANLVASAAKNGSDTLVVWPSEPLAKPTGARLLEFRRGGVVIPDSLVVFLSATAQADGSWKVVVGPASPFRPSAGDEVRLSTSGSTRDTVKQSNVPHPKHPWVVLSGALRTPYAASYQDGDYDGKIELAVLDFASPVTPGTVIRLYDPAGTSAFREVEVKPADSGKTRLELRFEPWGNNVTSLAKADLGLMLAGKTLDSNVYRSARFDIADSVPPVIASAKLRYTSDTSSVDTLFLDVSEAARFDLTKLIVRFHTAGKASDSGVALRPDSRFAAKYDSAKRIVTLFLTPFPQGYSNPASGDSVRFSWIGVSDAVGNIPGAKAKWTQVKANERVFPPIIQVSNPVVTEPGREQGDKIEGPQFEIVARESTPAKNGAWQRMGPGGWTPGTESFLPGTNGTVVFIQANVPTTIKLYLYDNMGVFVGTVSQFVSQEMLDRLPKSPIGMTDVGVLWKGQGPDGRLVASGIYPIRLLALREPVAEEKALGKVGTYIYNKLVNVGVKLRIDQ